MTKNRVVIKPSQSVIGKNKKTNPINRIIRLLKYKLVALLFMTTSLWATTVNKNEQAIYNSVVKVIKGDSSIEEQLEFIGTICMENENGKKILLNAFKKLDNNGEDNRKCPEWQFLAKSVHYNFWNIADFICEKVLVKDKNYRILDDINVKEALAILSKGTDTMAVEVLWKLTSHFNFAQGLFWRALIEEEWEIAETLKQRDKMDSLDPLFRFQSNVEPEEYDPKSDPESIYQLLKGTEYPRLQEFFILKRDEDDTASLCKTINEDEDTEVFKKMLGTAGSRCIWKYVNKSLKEKMIKELFNSTGYYEMLWKKETTCKWATYDVEQDLISYAKKQFGIRLAVAGSIGFICIYAVVSYFKSCKKKKKKERDNVQMLLSRSFITLEQIGKLRKIEMAHQSHQEIKAKYFDTVRKKHQRAIHSQSCKCGRMRVFILPNEHTR